MCAAGALRDEGYRFTSWPVIEGTVSSDMTIELTFKAITKIDASITSDSLDFKKGVMFDPTGSAVSLTYADGSYGPWIAEGTNPRLLPSIAGRASEDR